MRAPFFVPILTVACSAVPGVTLPVDDRADVATAPDTNALTPDVPLGDAQVARPEDAAATTDASARLDALMVSPSVRGFDCSRIRTPPGFTWASSPREFTDVPTRHPGHNLLGFPFTGSSLGLIMVEPRTYVSLRFVAPHEPPPVRLHEVGAIDYQGAYFAQHITLTLSRCPGDFRIPTIGVPPPADDPTFAVPCRSNYIDWNGGRPVVPGSIKYNTASVSNEHICGLVAGETYYLNIGMVDLTDGLSPLVPPCATDFGENACGIWFFGR